MKKSPLRTAGQAVSLLLAACLLAGCAALLERSYSVAEPYADRYWDSGAEDTLRVESYQDLVNSLLLLIEERAEEGVILCYGEVGESQKAMAAREEVCRETTLGAYLLRDLRISYESSANYITATCQMVYREDAEDLASVMTLSDAQSLVDLLRLTVREEREKLTARFSYDTPREDVNAAVESFWQELCQAETEEASVETAGELTPESVPEDGTGAPEDAENAETAPPDPDAGPEEEAAPPDGAEPGEASPAETDNPEPPPEEALVEYPPCPWQVKFYPDKETAEIVEVLLRS